MVFAFAIQALQLSPAVDGPTALAFGTTPAVVITISPAITISLNNIVLSLALGPVITEVLV